VGPPDMADCLRFREGSWSVGSGGKRRELGPGEFEKSRGGEESARASMVVGSGPADNQK
jgi:hypothetical protein